MRFVRDRVICIGIAVTYHVTHIASSVLIVSKRTAGVARKLVLLKCRQKRCQSLVLERNIYKQLPLLTSVKYILTSHARQRMQERKIALSEIDTVVTFPDYTLTKNNLTEFHKNFSTRSLKVVGFVKGTFIKILTVMEKS